VLPLCRCLQCVQLEYLGRADRQIKINGVRMEISEVEAVLAGAPGEGCYITVVSCHIGWSLHAAACCLLLPPPGRCLCHMRLLLVKQTVTVIARHLLLLLLLPASHCRCDACCCQALERCQWHVNVCAVAAAATATAAAAVVSVLQV
jgi:hypothetical protein